MFEVLSQNKPETKIGARQFSVKSFIIFMTESIYVHTVLYGYPIVNNQGVRMCSPIDINCYHLQYTEIGIT